MRSIALIFAFLLGSGALAQTPPTATEVFNLRIRCKEIADRKAEDLSWHPMDPASGREIGISPAAVEKMNEQNKPEIILETHSSKYDAKNNRCYVYILSHTRRAGFEIEHRQLYDGQTDDMIAFTKAENGKKVGMVFDRSRQMTTDTNLGWDDADAYMSQMMDDRPR